MRSIDDDGWAWRTIRPETMGMDQLWSSLELMAGAGSVGGRASRRAAADREKMHHRRTVNCKIDQQIAMTIGCGDRGEICTSFFQSLR